MDQAPVAVCTLTDDALAATVAREAGPEVAMVGTLQTENLGIERLIQKSLAGGEISIRRIEKVREREAKSRARDFRIALDARQHRRFLTGRLRQRLHRFPSNAQQDHLLR